MWGRLGAWAALLVAAGAAAAAGAGVQVGFAAAAIGGLGLAHGASDLAIVAPDRRPAFLLAYLAVLAGALGWWIARPGLALPLFLALSALHFAWEDASGPLARLVYGVLPIAGPAVLYDAGLTAILTKAGGDPAKATLLAGLLHLLGLAIMPLTAWLIVRDRDLRLTAGALALYVMPPLVGFSLGFLILHALPQTTDRARRLGCPDGLAYYRHVLSLLATAGLIVVLGAALFLRFDPSGTRLLFAAIAAFAVPHMLVTPVFQGKAAWHRWLRFSKPKEMLGHTCWRV